MNTKPSVHPAWGALGLVLAFVPSAFAQTLSPELAKAGEEACVNLAASKGFALTKVVSVGPKEGTTDAVTIVLSLDRAGEPYKLTCGYTAAGGVTTSADQAPAETNANPILQGVSDLMAQVTSPFTKSSDSEPAAETAPEPAAETAPAAEAQTASVPPAPVAETAPVPPAPVVEAEPVVQTAPAPVAIDPTAIIDATVDASSDFVTNADADSIPSYSTPSLWWLLLPLIGMPLFLFWLSKRGAGRTGTDVTDADQLEAIVQSSDQPVKIYAYPNVEDEVIGTLHDGELVLLSGRQNKGWAELVSGGWVSTQYLNLDAKYSIR